MYNLYDEEEEENPPPISQVCCLFLYRHFMAHYLLYAGIYKIAMLGHMDSDVCYAMIHLPVCFPDLR